MRSRACLAVALTLVFVSPPMLLTAQSRADADRVRTTSVAGSRPLSLVLTDVSFREALDTLSHIGDVRFTFSSDRVEFSRRVSIRADSVPFDEVVESVLRDLGLTARPTRSGILVLTPAPERQPLLEPMPAARTGTITGRVTDAATGAPVAGADVRVAGTQLIAAANDSGRYVLPNVPAGEQSVAAQRIGYETETQSVTVPEGGTVTLDFALDAMATRLNELVVTVTGEQRVREVGNVVARIQADSLVQSAPVMSLGDLMLGRAPGVLSITTSGNSGQSGAIRLRGLNSFQDARGANAPIVVVDGVRVEAGSGTGDRGPQSLDPTNLGGYTGRLADFELNEIASVEVVKGPSAATLYGTDAANGVIVITTKRGQAGRTRWTAFTEHGLLEQRLDFADQFPDAYYAFGRSTADDTPQRCTLVQRAEGMCVVDSLATFNTMTDPATRPFKDGHRQEYGVQVSGGTSGGATYFLSGDYEQETGTQFMPELDQALIRETQGRVPDDWQVRPNRYERLNLRANVTTPLGPRGSATLSTGYIANQGRQPFISLGPQVGYRDENDGWLISGGTTNARPAYAFANRGEDVVRRFLGSVGTTYILRDGLTLRGTVGADLSTNTSSSLVRRGEDRNVGAGASNNTGWRNVNEFNVARYSLDVGATATRDISAKLSTKTSVGLQYNRRAQRSLNVIADNLPLGGETIAGGSIWGNPVEVTITSVVAGGFVEEVLGFQDRLFLTGAVRFDGGSAFGQNFGLSAYPKASLSWVVGDGEIGPQLPGVSSLRLRAAYGASGKQPGPTDALSRVIISTGTNLDGTGTAPTGSLVGGNPELKPERTTELEGGLDLELWESRVRLEFTAYQKTTEDALVARPNAPSVGGSRIENLGSVRNRGLELLLGADLVRSERLAAGFTATGSVNQNELLRLGDGVTVRNPTSRFTQQEVGYPLFGYWDTTIESFADANGNGIIEPTDLVLTGPNTSFLGSTFPTREGTVSPYVKLFGERLHLSGLLQYRGGAYAANYTAQQNCWFFGTCRAVNDANTPLAEQARAIAAASFSNLGAWVESTSYLQWRELSLGLAVPPALARVVGAEGGQLMLAGRNLALLWKAGDNPIENAGTYGDDNNSGLGGSISAGPASYWLLRVQLTY